MSIQSKAEALRKALEMDEVDGADLLQIKHAARELLEAIDAPPSDTDERKLQAQAYDAYLADARRCCERCYETALADQSEVAFTHGFIKGLQSKLSNSDESVNEVKDV